MHIANRQEREKAEMCANILKAARTLLNSEGIEGISIRKIANIIEYSPTIIYHYFKNKDEIIEQLIAEDYRKIIESLTETQVRDKNPQDQLRAGIINFITLAVEMGDTYKNTMLNSSPAVLARASMLHRGASTERPTLSIMCDNLRKMPYLEQRDDVRIELTSQIIWSTTFGLALRLIVEHVDEEQQRILIEHAAEFVIHALENK